MSGQVLFLHTDWIWFITHFVDIFLSENELVFVQDLLDSTDKYVLLFWVKW